MEQIKKCPFCGEDARLVAIDDDGEIMCINCEEELETTHAYIHCYGCDMDYMPNTDRAKDVITEWNRRV